MISSALLLPLFMAVVRAQTTHTVIVGGSAGLVYTPPTVSAMVGDTIHFEFQQKNHSAVQSAFATPCKPLTDAYGNLNGFNSGFRPVGANDTSDFPTFDIKVNDTAPIWVYCAQTGHCPQGMVFAVNAPASGNTFAKFQAAALATAGSSSVSSSDSSSDSYSTSTAWTSPPPPVIETVTATVTVDDSVYTTTIDAWSGQSSPDPTPNALPAVHTVVVGGQDLVYTPNQINASIGDTVTFQFNVKNHSATQSTFNNPCTKSGGFDSEFNPVAANASVFPTFNVTVNSTEPIWVYCRQTGHCQKGMVMAINAPSTGSNTFAAFQELAEHTNASTNAASTNPSSGSSSSSSGAGRAAVSAGLTMGVVGVLAFALL